MEESFDIILGFERGDYERVGRGFYNIDKKFSNETNTIHSTINSNKSRLKNDRTREFYMRFTEQELKRQKGKRVKVLYFRNGLPDGETDIGTVNSEGCVVIKGKKIYKNNHVYKAERILYTDGTLYDGQTMASPESRPHGEGCRWQPNGDFSTGWFVTIPGAERGILYEGFVTQRLRNGDVYEGELKDGKREGYGKMTYTNGTIYEGEFFNNKKEGKGKMTYTNGFVSVAYWENGHKDGEETICQGNHVLFTRQWENGRITNERIEDRRKIDTINRFKAWERGELSEADLLNNNDNIINNDDINKKNKKGCSIF